MTLQFATVAELIQTTKTMHIYDYLMSLDIPAREDLAKRCGTTLDYLQNQLALGHRSPTLKRMRKVEVETGGRVKIKDWENGSKTLERKRAARDAG